ncbi:carbohydrate ABC transporter permease [Xylanimonas protaetiae]|uniref:Carbohydrate ABC transporter permease n=1 Tax=Xylanimonas protaetiae TaxID=2509457 RepID=A0A4P6F4A1_9MICO|nr:carbohydrate ABC transporter permease [Xylanimonas protaetiae]QAY70750.1 carbohydrate ABC transporter permease [Xylanimonas protaetiae]
MSTSTMPATAAGTVVDTHRARANRRRVLTWGKAVVLLLVMLVINMPLILTAVNSFRPRLDIMAGSTLMPERVTLDNYRAVIGTTHYPEWFLNSVWVSLVATAVVLVASGLAGYSLSRYRTRVNSVYSNMLMVFQLFPLVLSIVGLMVLFVSVGLTKTFVPAIVLYIVMALPFCTWMFKGFFDSIPRELEEAARVDGCSSFRAMISVVVPLAGPGAAAVAIYAFLLAYNEYMVASAFLKNPASLNTISIGLRSFFQQNTTEWGQMLAASTLAVLPPLVLFLLVQKWMIRGMAAGAVKG